MHSRLRLRKTEKLYIKRRLTKLRRRPQHRERLNKTRSQIKLLNPTSPRRELPLTASTLMNQSRIAARKIPHRSIQNPLISTPESNRRSSRMRKVLSLLRMALKAIRSQKGRSRLHSTPSFSRRESRKPPKRCTRTSRKVLDSSRRQSPLTTNENT